jgi:hypothetical protein
MQNIIDLFEYRVRQRRRNSVSKLPVLFAVGLFLLAATRLARAVEPVKISMTADH